MKYLKGTWTDFIGYCSGTPKHTSLELESSLNSTPFYDTICADGYENTKNILYIWHVVSYLHGYMDIVSSLLVELLPESGCSCVALNWRHDQRFFCRCCNQRVAFHCENVSRGPPGHEELRTPGREQRNGSIINIQKEDSDITSPTNSLAFLHQGRSQIEIEREPHLCTPCHRLCSGRYRS